MPLDIFLGDATPLHATLYARLPAGDEFSAGTLVGFVTGPRCATSRMLPADYALRDLGPGPTRLARAMIPDPCYWSSELPALYDVRVEWRVDGVTRRSWNRTVGLRRVGVRGRNLSYEGRRWVLRAVRDAATADRDFPVWPEAATAYWTRELSAADGAETTRVGVPVVVRIGERGDALLDRLRQASQVPSVVAAVIDGAAFGGAGQSAADVDAAVARARQASPSLLWLAEATANGQFPDWADAWVVAADRLTAADDPARGGPKPIIAYRPLAAPTDLQTARAACDELQRELAPFGDFAGYVV